MNPPDPKIKRMKPHDVTAPPNWCQNMTKDYQQQAEEILNELHSDRVFSVEDGLVWVSGMNQHCKTVAEDMAKTLIQHGVPCGLVHDDGIHAADNGGVQFRYGESA